mgnify:FL=1
MRVIIAGGRDFNDFKLLESNINKIFKQLSDEKSISAYIDESNIEIICGKARGADTLGEQFAKEYKLSIKYFPADWNTYGKSAGYRRNAEMANYAKEDNGVLIAFWDGKSKGTKHMIDIAKSNNIRLFIVSY